MTYCCVHGEDSKVGGIAWVDIDGCPWRYTAVGELMHFSES